MRLRDLAAARPRYGYRRLTVLLRREGRAVNAKRVYRLYKEEGLTVRVKRRRKLAAQARVPLPAPAAPGERWAMDFMSDALMDGSRFRVLTVVDVFTRECVALEPATSLPADAVTALLDRALRRRKTPAAITIDNGTEFTSRHFDGWAYERGIALDFIRPGRPMENGYIESFNGKVRDECLNMHWFADLDEARRLLDAWRRHYNTERPHSSLGDRPPEAYAASLLGCSPAATL
jgi:putative transposase